MTGPVVVIGDIMTDIVVKPYGDLALGTDQFATITPLPGGSAANQAVWLASNDVPVRLCSRVGAEDHARIVRSLRQAGVDPVIASDPDRPTGSLVALIAPDGERSFFTDRGANDELDHDDLPATVLDGAALLHVSGYALVAPKSRAAVLDLIAAARRREIAVTLDPGSAGFLRRIGPERFLHWTAGAAICFPNGDEAATLAATQDRSEQLQRLSDIYHLVVVKRGASGADAANRHGDRWVAPGKSAAVLDTSGAGDAFLAAFLASYLKGGSVPICLAHGTEAGAQATEFFGGRPALTWLRA